jgi:protein-disulfide isomerase
MRLDATRWLAVPAVLLGAAGAAAQSPAGKGRDPVLAQSGDLKITQAQLDEKIAGQLFAIKNQEYALKEQTLLEMVGQALLEKQAKAEGISPQELLKREVEAKVADADVNADYERVKARAGNRPEPEVKSQLRQQRIHQRRAEYVGELRNKAGVRLFLDPPRAKVSVGDDPAKGPQTALVTIVEFSDFQCPYCANAGPTVKRILETYKDQVRVVFRDYPLNFHAQAPKAAEAASCANEQGKFWEMHDRLFANQQKLQVADLKQHAAALGLNSQTFDQCLDSGKYGSEWRQDMEDGTRAGVNGTPAFFVNGRLLSGAQPFEAFSRVIDDELARAKGAKPAKSAPAKSGT